MRKESMLNKPEPEKIIEALHILQDTCTTYYWDDPDNGFDSCNKCPLATQMPDGRYICTVIDLIPCNLDIGEAPDVAWKAFK